MPTLTFLFTDIEASTRLWEAYPDAMKGVLAAHDQAIEASVHAKGGRVFKHSGDGALASFGSAADALSAAAEIQRIMARTAHPEVGALRLRMAVHTGEVEERGGDFFGPPLNRAARLMSVAHGGQVLVSLVTERLASARLPEDLSLRNLGEHRLRDLARPEQVFQLDIDGLDSEFPPLRTPDLVPNNLPTMATSFVGRHQELAELTKLIRGSRMVTITGVGGAGKTRLALQAATEVGTEFPDGLWLIELAGVADAELVDAAAAEALAVGQTSGSMREAVLQHLADREALVVFDNCEHLVAAVADLVAEVLAWAPKCRVVATSRELLGVSGEVAYGLGSMAVPLDGGGPDPSEYVRYDAVRLFLERAAASNPSFRVSGDALDAIAEICRRLDGIPLALELAAARLRMLAPRQIAENLDQRFRLLTGGSRTALPRQQTLAAAIDWSYRLLSPAEQSLFRRLSVFQGGFTLGAVTEVCTNDDLDALDVLELLGSLVDKSLVVVDAAREKARYRLLETIRQFARERHDDTGEAGAIRRRHARFYRDLAVEAGRNIRGPDETLWWQRIDTELENLRQAMTWAMESGEGELALEAAGGFWRYWWFKSRWSEGVGWLERALQAAGPGAAKPIRAQGLLAFGSLLEPADRHMDAAAALRQAVELYEQMAAEGAPGAVLRLGYAAAYINLSVELAIHGGDPDEIEELNRKALEVSRRIGDAAGEAVALGNLAESAARRGELGEARRLFTEGVAASQALASAQRMVEMYWQLGLSELAFGAPDDAQRTLADAAILADGAGLEDQAALTRAFAAACRFLMGDRAALTAFKTNGAEVFDNPDHRTSGWMLQELSNLRASMDLDAADPAHGALIIGASFALEEEGWVPSWQAESLREKNLVGLREQLGDQRADAMVAEGRQIRGDALVEMILA